MDRNVDQRKPLDRDGTRVRPIALTEALVKLAQGKNTPKATKERRAQQSEGRLESTTHRDNSR